MNLFYFWLLLIGTFFFCFHAQAQTTVELLPVADNTLYIDPSGSLSNGSGQNFFTGVSQAGLTRRGLIKFEPADSISSYAEISSVELSLYMNMTVSGSNTISLYQVSKAWGEGPTVSAGGGGTGGVVQPGDATWIHTFYPDSFWSNPGGDYDPLNLATTNVNTTGFYVWTSPALTATVESWLQYPATNHGLILIGDESVYPNAKRFASRENINPLHRPRLIITYTLACDPADEPVITTDSTSYCEGDSVFFTVSGNLNNATVWALYADSCGGIPISTSATEILIVEGGGSGHYFVRGEGGCPDPGICSSVMVSISPAQDASFYYPDSSVCNNHDKIMPVLTGTPGGHFEASPPGIQMDELTGEIDVGQSNPGNYIITYFSPGPGCPVSNSFPLSVKPVYETLDSVEICIGDVYILGSQSLTEPGSYTEVLASASNCDSLVVLHLTVAGPDSNIHQQDQVLTAIQEGAGYQWIDCQDNMGPIPGENEQIFTATSNGYYAVIISLGECSVMSPCVAVTNLSSSSHNEVSKLLEVYLNPASQRLEVNALTMLNFTLVDITGKNVFHEELTPGQHSLNLYFLPEGMYFIKAESDKMISVIPLAIMH